MLQCLSIRKKYATRLHCTSISTDQEAEHTWSFSRISKLLCPQNNQVLTFLMVKFTAQSEAVLMHATKHKQKWKPNSTHSPMHAPDGGEQSASCPGRMTRGREHLVLPEQDRRVANHCVVSTVTRIQVNDPGFESQQGQEISLFSKMSKWLWGPAGRGSGVLNGRREADHSMSSSAQVKNEWCHPSIPPIHLYSIHRENQFYCVLFSTHEGIKSILNS